MSTHIEFAAQGTHPAIPRRGLLIAVGVTVAAIGAYTFAAPYAAFASAVHASVVAPATSAAVDAQLSAAQLDALLNARFAPANSAATQQGATAAAQVSAMLGNGDGTVSPNGKLLTLSVPAVAGLGASVDAALAPIGAQMGDLNGPDGQVAASVNNSVTAISPLLKLTGPNASVTANVPIDLNAAVAPALSGTTGSGVVTLDPSNGSVVIDLSKLLSGNPTSSTGNVPALSDADQAQIAADINAAASVLGTNVVNSATSSVQAAPVNVTANVHLLSQPTSGSSSCSTSSDTSTTAAPAAGGLLGGALSGLLGGAINSVEGTVGSALCSLPNLLPAVLTSLELNLGGNVGQVIEGTAPPATGAVTVLGQSTPLNTGAVSNGVANALVSNFAGPTTTGDSTTGSGSGTGSTTCPPDTLLTVCLNANTNVGGTNANVLGNLGLGNSGLVGNVGTTLNGLSLNGLNPWITGNLLSVGNTAGGLTVGVGNGSGSSGTGTGTNLLNINAGTNPNGSIASVNVGQSASSGSTGSGNLLNLNVGSPAGGSTSGQGLLLNIGN